MKKIVDSIVNYRENSILEHNDDQLLEDIIDSLKTIEPKMVLLQVDINRQEQLLLIGHFYEWYFDTNQNTNVFAKEYYEVVGYILKGYIPVKLEYLDDYIDLLIETVPRFEDRINVKLEEI